MQLSINGRLQIKTVAKTKKALLKSYNAVTQKTTRLKSDALTNLWLLSQAIKHLVSAVKEMEHELKTRIGIKMDSISLVSRSLEAGQQHEILGRASLISRRKAGQNLSQSIPIPKWPVTVHWRTGKEAPLRILGALTGDHSEEVLEDRVNTQRQRIAAGRRCDEVGDAANDADIHVDPNSGERRPEGLHHCAGDHLGFLHGGSITAVDGAHMSLDI